MTSNRWNKSQCLCMADGGRTFTIQYSRSNYFV